jgi:hypothetical protein
VRAASDDVTDAIQGIRADSRGIVDDGKERRKVRVEVAHDRDSHGRDSAQAHVLAQSPAGVTRAGLSALQWASPVPRHRFHTTAMRDRLRAAVPVNPTWESHDSQASDISDTSGRELRPSVAGV